MSRHAQDMVTLGVVGDNIILTVGINPSGLNASARIANESTYVFLWKWGDDNGYLYPGSMDVIYPGSMAGDINIKLQKSLVDVTKLPAGTLQALFWEIAFDTKFPGVYPQILIPYAFVVAVA